MDNAVRARCSDGACEALPTYPQAVQQEEKYFVIAHPPPSRGHGLQRPPGEGEADCFEGIDAWPAPGFDDGSDISIEPHPPFGAEAIGDFAEGDTGAQRALGFVVGGRDGPVGHEDEHVAADFMDHALEFDTGSMSGCETEEAVEAGIKVRGEFFQHGIAEFAALASEPAGPAEQMAHGGREDRITAVDGILRVTDEMGEADLMALAGPAHLAAVAVRHPVISTEFPEEVRGRPSWTAMARR